jgi:tRNA isopentenyl-2-thiomethyl-A-37 hydroxylase MiaE
LLQITDFFFKSFDSQRWVDNGVEDSLILDFHHSGGELKRRNSLFQMHRSAVNIGEHNSFAVTADGVSQKVSQSSLSVWDVISLSVRQSQHHLLQVRKTLVDMSGFFQLPSGSPCLFGSLGTSKIHQVQF